MMARASGAAVKASRAAAREIHDVRARMIPSRERRDHRATARPARPRSAIFRCRACDGFSGVAERLASPARKQATALLTSDSMPVHVVLMAAAFAPSDKGCLHRRGD